MPKGGNWDIGFGHDSVVGYNRKAKMGFVDTLTAIVFLITAGWLSPDSCQSLEWVLHIVPFRTEIWNLFFNK